MFRENMCPSSGENTIPMRHLALFTLHRWLSGMQGGIPWLFYATKSRGAHCKRALCVCYDTVTQKLCYSL